MKEEKIIEKIKNLFDLAGNNPNENEAMAAALKAQELMAKYNINASQINTESADNEIFHARFEDSSKHEMKKWKARLCQVIARNFCCEVYFSGSAVVFYGYKKDAEIALETFGFLYKAGNKLAVKYYNKCKKEFKDTKGVMNTYLAGFVKGIQEELGKQCTALMIVTPKEVKDSFTEMSAEWKHKNVHLKINGVHDEAYAKGKQDGKDAIESKTLEDKSMQ